MERGAKPNPYQGLKRVKAKPIRPLRAKASAKRELWATVAYYYPQYSLERASQLSVRDIRLLLKVAKAKEAERMFYLTQIAAAPHTEKGKGVKQLSDYFRKEFER